MPQSSLEKTARALYDFIGEDLYLNRWDVEVHGRRFNAALLLSLLTGLCGGRILLAGEPGMGKTTSAEYVSSLVYRLPLEVVWKAEVSGHPEQTEEKIVGRPDLGSLNRGREVVIWSYFTLLPTKIVDEINRLPETKQSLVLDGVDRGKWEYLNESVINREFCLFATANYQDRGTHTIIPPLLDRFDVSAESKHPGANLAYHIGNGGKGSALLRDPDLEREFHRALTSFRPYEERLDELETLSERFGARLKAEAGLPTFSRADRQAVGKALSSIPFDLDANAFLRFVISELSFCHVYGQKRSHEACEEGCHFSQYLCREIRNCVSNRLAISARNYARALAWMLGHHSVDVEHLKTVLPFCLAHRIQWKEEFLAQREKESRSDPVPLHMARRAVMETHRRYTEQSDLVKDALARAFHILEDGAGEPVRGEHPLFWEIRRDLGEEFAAE
jgi:MoxR-like ATPase